MEPINPNDIPGTVRRNPTTRASATRTDIPGAGREWFVFDVRNGGYYTDGIREKVDEWTLGEFADPEVAE